MTILAAGRAFDGIDVCPAVIDWRGNTLQLEGAVSLPAGTANALDKLRACRDRLLALVDNRDEIDVAVTYTLDASVAGFYRPESVSVSEPLHIASTLSIFFTVALRRVGGGPLPQVEVHGLHAVRANGHSITSATLNGGNATPMLGYPNSALDAWSGAAALFAATRTSASGVVRLSQAHTFPKQFATTYSVPVGDHYIGACEIRTTYGSAAGQLVAGRWAPSGWAGVILSNGLIRVSKHASSGTGLFVEVFDGTQWEPLNTSGTYWQVESDWAGGTVTWDWANAGMQILRNSPEVCSIRLFTPDAAAQGTWGRVWLDLTVQRGMRHIAAQIQCDTPSNFASNKFAIKPSTSIAATALTGAVRATSNDGQGNRAVWGAAGGAITNNLTTGRLVQTSAGATQMPFLIGAEVGGSTATGRDAAQLIAYEWYDVRTEAQRIVRR